MPVEPEPGERHPAPVATLLGDAPILPEVTRARSGASFKLQAKPVEGGLNYLPAGRSMLAGAYPAMTDGFEPSTGFAHSGPPSSWRGVPLHEVTACRRHTASATMGDRIAASPSTRE